MSAFLLMLATVAPAVAFEAELQRYYAGLAHICRTGVTPEITAAYAQARAAVDTARASRDPNNFWGLKTPENAWLDCFQSPGDGKQ